MASHQQGGHQQQAPPGAGGFPPGFQQHHHTHHVQQQQQQQQHQQHQQHQHQQQHHGHHQVQVPHPSIGGGQRLSLPPITPDQHHHLHGGPPHHHNQQQQPHQPTGGLVAQLPPVGGGGVGGPPTAAPAAAVAPPQPTTTTTTTTTTNTAATTTTTTGGASSSSKNDGGGTVGGGAGGGNSGGGSKPRNRSWDENYAELLTYKATHNGSTDVPLTYKNDRILGKWVAHLREHQNQAALSQERRDALNAIGFIWNPHEQKWNEMYARLKEYKSSTGHCKVPTNWKNDRKLGKWVMRQREKRKNNLLPDHRLQKLESIGFVWKIYSEPKTRKSTIIDERWNARYQELIEYRDTNSHCNVPKDYGPLGKWVQEQRVMHQRKLLKADRKKLLEDIGFIFSYRAQKCQQDWNQMYELLKACSTTTEDGQFKVLGMDTGLSRWVHRQKEAYKTNRLDPGREVLLNKIGFQFPEKLPMVHNLKRDGYGGGSQQQDLSTGLGGGMAGMMGVAGGANNTATGMFGGTTPHVSTTDPTAAFRNNSPLKQPPADTTESERRIGLRLADGIDAIAQYMNISHAEVSARLALHKPKEQPPASSSAPAAAAASTPTLRESPRRKAAAAAAAAAAKKQSSDENNNKTDENNNGGDGAASSPTKKKASSKAATSANNNNKKGDVNALGKLLPAIIALQTLSKQEKTESIMVEASKQLESHIRQEKGWDPRPSEGNIYHRLLSLAAELGVLLDPTSDRCQSIMTLAEKQLKFIITNYNKKRKQQQQEQKEKEKEKKQTTTKAEDEEEKKSSAGAASESNNGEEEGPANGGTAKEEGEDDKKEEEEASGSVDEPASKRRKVVDETVVV